MNKFTNSTIKLIPLGGSGNVTNNMYAYESETDILIVDCGIGFPDDTVPGIDLTIPDASYLFDKKSKIKGIVLTHAHEDHIGGLPFILPQIGESIPIYTSSLTAGFLKEKFKEFSLSPKTINVLKDRQPIQVGVFEIKFIPVTHSVPDTKHIIIKSPAGTIYHGADFKFDWTPIGNEKPPDIQSITKAGAEGITLLLSDCLRSEKDGYSLSESVIEDSFEREFRDVKGRVVVTTMSSSIARIQQALWVAKRNNRKVAFVGFSIERNTRVASSLGFLNIPPRLVLNKRKISSLPRDQICLIVAGSQGQMGSSLTRIAEGSYDNISLEAGDKVIFSADPIPGNEKNVYRVIDLLSKQRVIVSYSDISEDLHVSGHASSRELMMLISFARPKYVMPIGGTYRHMVEYRKLAQKMGIPEERVILSESQIINIKGDGTVTYGDTLELKNIYVEGSEVSSEEDRLSDRKLMFQEGAVIILTTFARDRGPLDIDIIPKGVTKEIPGDVISEIKSGIAQALKDKDIKGDRLYIKDKVAKIANKIFIDRLSNNPLIVPVVIEG